MASIRPSAPASAGREMETLPAQSSFIAAFEYDPQNLTLTTHMKNGSIYQHKFVLPMEWDEIKTSQNHSKHWADTIRSKKASVRVKAAKAPNSEIKTGRKQ